MKGDDMTPPKSKEIKLEDIEGLVEVTKAQTEAQMKVNSNLDDMIKKQGQIANLLDRVADKMDRLDGGHETLRHCIEIEHEKTRKTSIEDSVKVIKATNSIGFYFRIFIYVAGGLLMTCLGALATKFIF